MGARRYGSFCNQDSTELFHLKSQRQRTLRLLFEDCRFIYFHSLKRSAFFPEKGYCIYMINK